MNSEVYIHPDRKMPRIRPLKALKHFRNLVANKEDTEQVFHIVECLGGRNFIKNFENFTSTPKGAARLKERRYLPPLLDDHDSLRQLPAGSVGRAYVDFMEREGLTAQGLVDEYASFGQHIEKYSDDLEWYSNRLRDTHDLMHILTGYSRDALGEASILAFTHGQHKNLGIIFISYMAAREFNRHAPKGANVFKMIAEGKHNGKAAQEIAAEDIMELLAENLEDARKRLNIAPATVYHNAIDVYAKHDMDPYAVLSPA